MQKNYAVVTGASQGIGKALAFELAKRSYNLILLALPESGLEKVADNIISRFHVEVLCYELNLTNMDEIDSFSQWLKNLHLPIEVWINNAGAGYNGTINQFNKMFFERLIRLNVNAMVQLSLLFINDLKNKNQTRYLLNVASMASFFCLPNKTVYSASKSFVLNFSRALREEVKQDNISVSCLCPGPVETNKEVTERISKTGWGTKYFINTPEKVAIIALKGLLNRKPIIIPDFKNKFLRMISCVVPHKIIILLTSRIFSSKSSSIIKKNADIREPVKF